MGAAVSGQTDGPKVISEISTVSTSADKIVKGSPFSAEAVSESVQVLTDGNRIVRNSTSKLYRNSEGRFRRELSAGSGGGVVDSLFSYGQGVTILDPVIGHRYSLDPNMKTARVTILGAGTRTLSGTGTARVIKTIRADPAQKVTGQEKPASEVKPAIVAARELYTKALNGTAASAELYTKALSGFQASSAMFPHYGFTFGQQSKYELRTEQLGTQNFEGVDAEGTRTITTIPAGAIGNERPIEMIYEKWYSKELELVVMSKNSDPRFGDQTYRLTNIARSEPDATLFSVPTEYKLLTGPTSAFTFTTPKAVAPVTAPKAATAVDRAKP